jgi:hypothetical protein
VRENRESERETSLRNEGDLALFVLIERERERERERE